MQAEFYKGSALLIAIRVSLNHLTHHAPKTTYKLYKQQAYKQRKPQGWVQARQMNRIDPMEQY